MPHDRRTLSHLHPASAGSSSRTYEVRCPSCGGTQIVSSGAGDCPRCQNSLGSARREEVLTRSFSSDNDIIKGG